MKIPVFTMLLLMLLSSCKQEHTVNKSRQPSVFANTLNLNGWPKDNKDRSVYSFSDLGAWHSYALSPKPSGGFVGPFLMTDDNGLWAARQMVTLKLTVNGKNLRWADATLLSNEYLPGRLVQSYQIDSLIITQRLIFISDRSTLIQFEIMSDIKQPLIEAKFAGSSWLEDWEFGTENGMVNLTSQKSNTEIVINFIQPFEGKIIEQSFESATRKFDLNANFPVKLNYIQSAYFSNEEKAREEQLIAQASSNPKWCFESNLKRWNDYIESTLSTSSGGAVDSAYQRLAVKSLNTLVNNWRSAAGELKHDGLFPSYAYGGFHGFWSWDSWKHAVGLAEIIPSLAKDQIKTMYDYQDIDGMIADCIFRDTLIENHNWRDTKPPLSGWAIYKVFEASQDTAFVKTLYPKLARYHQWWYDFRDHNGNELCEYGSTDGTRVAAAWESGMDNAVRFDLANMLTNANGGYSLDQESVDLNAYLFAEKHYLSKLAILLGHDDDAETYQKEAEQLADMIEQHFYDADNGYYFDKGLNGESIEVYGPEGWIPLWAEVSQKDVANKIVKHMLDESKFNTYVPFPTLDASHQKFNPKDGYWRGPVWLDQAYFGIVGLRKYGYQKEADALLKKMLNNAEGLLGEVPIRENYHPVTGEGLNANHFSWSAAHILMLIRE